MLAIGIVEILGSVRHNRVHQSVFIQGAFQPLPPRFIGVGVSTVAQIVELVGHTVGHEDHDLLTVGGGRIISPCCKGFIGNMERSVVVGTAVGLQKFGVEVLHVLNVGVALNQSVPVIIATGLIDRNLANQAVGRSSTRLVGRNDFFTVNNRNTSKVVIVTEFGDCHLDIGHGAVGVGLRQGIDQLFQCITHQFDADPAVVQAVQAHGTGGIHDNQNIQFGIHRNAAGGQVDPGNAGLVKDILSGIRLLVHADGAGVGVNGIIRCGIAANQKGVVIGQRNILVGCILVGCILILQAQTGDLDGMGNIRCRQLGITQPEHIHRNIHGLHPSVGIGDLNGGTGIGSGFRARCNLTIGGHGERSGSGVVHLLVDVNFAAFFTITCKNTYKSAKFSSFILIVGRILDIHCLVFEVTYLTTNCCIVTACGRCIIGCFFQVRGFHRMTIDVTT